MPKRKATAESHDAKRARLGDDIPTDFDMDIDMGSTHGDSDTQAEKIVVSRKSEHEYSTNRNTVRELRRIQSLTSDKEVADKARRARNVAWVRYKAKMIKDFSGDWKALSKDAQDSFLTAWRPDFDAAQDARV